MPTADLVTLSEYLSADYEMDCDYVDGELQERNWGERPHATLQALLAAYFRTRWRDWNTVALIAQRVRISATRIRVVDICIVRRSDPADDVVQKAPLICIEVLSPEDRMNRIQERFADYAQMGVETLWLFDPLSRRAWTILPDGSQQRAGDILTVPDTPIRIVLAEVFAELDDMQSQG